MLKHTELLLSINQANNVYFQSRRWTEGSSLVETIQVRLFFKTCAVSRDLFDQILKPHIMHFFLDVYEVPVPDMKVSLNQKSFVHVTEVIYWYSGHISLQNQNKRIREHGLYAVCILRKLSLLETLITWNYPQNLITVICL